MPAGPRRCRAGAQGWVGLSHLQRRGGAGGRWRRPPDDQEFVRDRRLPGDAAGLRLLVRSALDAAAASAGGRCCRVRAAGADGSAGAAGASSTAAPAPAPPSSGRAQSRREAVNIHWALRFREGKRGAAPVGAACAAPQWGRTKRQRPGSCASAPCRRRQRIGRRQHRGGMATTTSTSGAGPTMGRSRARHRPHARDDAPRSRAQADGGIGPGRLDRLNVQHRGATVEVQAGARAGRRRSRSRRHCRVCRPSGAAVGVCPPPPPPLASGR